MYMFGNVYHFGFYGHVTYHLTFCCHKCACIVFLLKLSDKDFGRLNLVPPHPFACVGIIIDRTLVYIFCYLCSFQCENIHVLVCVLTCMSVVG